MCVLSRFSPVLLCVTIWTVAHQAPLSMGSSRQEYWIGLPSPLPGDLPDPWIKAKFLKSPALAGRFFTTSTISVAIQSLSHVWFFETPWTAARQASLSITSSQELAQTHIHRVGDAIQLSHLLSSPSPPALNLSQHQGLFQWVRSSHQVAQVLEIQPQHQSFEWIFRVDFL